MKCISGKLTAVGIDLALGRRPAGILCSCLALWCFVKTSPSATFLVKAGSSVYIAGVYHPFAFNSSTRHWKTTMFLNFILVALSVQITVNCISSISKSGWQVLGELNPI